MKKTDFFIRIPSSALAIGNEKKLTVEEINLFAWLQTMINWIDFPKQKYYVSCDLNLLAKTLKLNVNNLSREKKKIKQNLASLQKKGYLNFVETEFKTLEIELFINQDDVKAKPKFANKEMKYAGFTMIPISFLNQVKTKYDITILALVILRSGLENYQITRSEWAEVLEVSVKTAVEVVNGCELVETTIGKYVSENRQEANTYKLKGDSNTETLQDETFIDSDLKKVNVNKQSKKVDDSPIKRMHSQINDPQVVNDFETFEKLVDFNKKMDSESYLVYLETEDFKLKEFAERKIKKMRDSEKSKKILEKIISGAYSIKNNREIKKARDTFGTKTHFEAELKMYTDLRMMNEITSTEYKEMESYAREQLNNLENDIKPIQFDKWQKKVKTTENQNTLEISSEDIMIQDVDELSLKDESYDTDFDIDSLKNLIKAEFKGEDIIDNMLKNISDERVKYNKELFKEIQDFKTEMSLYAYEVILTTDDGKLREYGVRKLQNNIEMCLNLDKRYKQKYRKKKSATIK